MPLALAAELAASTKAVSKYTLPLGMRLLLRLPADSLFPGHFQAAQEVKLLAFVDYTWPRALGRGRGCHGK